MTRSSARRRRRLIVAWRHSRIGSPTSDPWTARVVAPKAIRRRDGAGRPERSAWVRNPLTHRRLQDNGQRNGLVPHARHVRPRLHQRNQHLPAWRRRCAIDRWLDITWAGVESPQHRQRKDGAPGRRSGAHRHAATTGLCSTIRRAFFGRFLGTCSSMGYLSRAGIAQLVERSLSKVEVTSSSLVSRSRTCDQAGCADSVCTTSASGQAAAIQSRLSIGMARRAFRPGCT